MQESYVADSRKFTDLVHQSFDSVNNSIDAANTDLIATLNRTLAKGWLDGKSSLHIHIGVRLVGETIPRKFCCLFTRKRLPTETLFQQDSIGVPLNDFSNVIRVREGQLSAEGMVLIHIGEPFDYCERNIAIIRLRLLDDCPRIPIDYYPIKNAELWISLSELDFVQEALFAFVDRKLVFPSWFMSVAKDKLPHHMVKSRMEVVEDIPCYSCETCVWDEGQWGTYKDIPKSIMPNIVLTGVHLLFDPNSKFRFQGVTVFFGPPEFSSDTTEVSDVSSHITTLYSADLTKSRDIA